MKLSLSRTRKTTKGWPQTEIIIREIIPTLKIDFKWDDKSRPIDFIVKDLQKHFIGLVENESDFVLPDIPDLEIIRVWSEIYSI